MLIRKGQTTDIDRIMEVYALAREFMRRSGNRNQWVNGYPSRELVMADIAAGNNYVGIGDDGTIEMTFAFILGDDPTYARIYDGAWPDNNPYGTIHRIASTGRYKGTLAECVGFCLEIIQNLRLDTHADNIPMQNAAKKIGFTRCGTIICADGTPRIAFFLSAC